MCRLTVPGWSILRYRKAITRHTILISVMYVNSEISHWTARDIGSIAREHGVLLHSDAVQGGKIPCDVDALQVVDVTVSPQNLRSGVGALCTPKPTAPWLQPLMDGGGHEGGYRSGTLNVPGIVGLGQACALCQQLQT
jgi:cysteine desulfurase